MFELKEVKQYYHRGKKVLSMWHKGKLVFDCRVPPWGPVPENALVDADGYYIIDADGNFIVDNN